ncbi:MAG: LacI family DNA-binding transcriptional regulator [Lachnospiraceae bacterium]|nr:LacI family DNA-binding transcriptional regulator [Lachnospiraceae bacterium]
MRRVTIKDIAKLAGVSYSTVSRALSGSTEISEATRERIRKICEEQGYHTNALARGLSNNRTNILGLIIPDITNPFFSELSHEIERMAHKNNYKLMLCNYCFEDVSVESLFDFLIGHQVEGIFYAGTGNNAAEITTRFSRTLPVVLLGDSFYESDIEEIRTVSMDNFIGGYMAANHLLALGHRHITYIGFRSASISHQHRYQGFQAAMDKAGISFETVENRKDSSSIDEGYSLGKKYFSEPLRSTALFCATDTIALGVMKAADEAGIAIPEEISLMGYDNIVYSSLPKIMLSTVDQNKKKIAENAMALMLESMENPESTRGKHIITQPKLVKRKSTTVLRQK